MDENKCILKYLEVNERNMYALYEAVEGLMFAIDKLQNNNSQHEIVCARCILDDCKMKLQRNSHQNQENKLVLEDHSRKLEEIIHGPGSNSKVA